MAVSTIKRDTLHVPLELSPGPISRGCKKVVATASCIFAGIGWLAYQTPLPQMITNRPILFGLTALSTSILAATGLVDQLTGPKFYKPVTPFIGGLHRPGYKTCCRARFDLDHLQKEGVTHLLSFGNVIHKDVERLHQAYWESKGLTYARCQTEDVMDFIDQKDVLETFFDEQLGVSEEKIFWFFEQVKEALKIPGAKMAVSCGAGIGRSGAFLVAYLVRYCDMTVDGAIEYLCDHYHEGTWTELRASEALFLLRKLESEGKLMKPEKKSPQTQAG